MCTPKIWWKLALKFPLTLDIAKITNWPKKIDGAIGQAKNQSYSYSPWNCNVTALDLLYLSIFSVMPRAIDRY